jgi:hypothetical protein
MLFFFAIHTEILVEHAKQFLRFHRNTPADIELKEAAAKILVELESSDWNLYEERGWKLNDLFPLLFYSYAKTIHLHSPKDVQSLVSRVPTRQVKLSLYIQTNEVLPTTPALLNRIKLISLTHRRSSKANFEFINSIEPHCLKVALGYNIDADDWDNLTGVTNLEISTHRIVFDWQALEAIFRNPHITVFTALLKISFTISHWTSNLKTAAFVAWDLLLPKIRHSAN